MSAVQVNNVKGEPLTKVNSGLTVAEVLKRIRYFGFLEDKNGLALADDDLITADGAPYVFKQQQLLQVDTVPEEYKQLAAFAKEEMDNRTKHKPMSEASVPFAEEILKGYGFTVAVAPLITECGSGADPPPYSWKIVDGKSKEWKKYEHAGTPGARDWVRDNLLGDDRTFGLKVVTSSMLPKIKANRRSASGKGDLAIGDPISMNYGEEYLFALTSECLIAERSKLNKSVFLKIGSTFVIFEVTFPNLIESKFRSFNIFIAKGETKKV